MASQTLVEWLRANRVPHKQPGEHEHARTGWVQVDCPWCGLEGHWRLGIQVRHLYANCWHCGRHNITEVIQALTGWGWGQAKDAAQALGAGALGTPGATPRPLGRLVLPKGLGPLQAAHTAYLRGRGFDPAALAQLWGIQGLGWDGRRECGSALRWRVWIPIHYRGKVVSWTTRSIAPDAHLRYVSAELDEEAMPHKELLYGEDYARHAIIIHEGPVDAWRVGPGAVATCGTAYSAAQVARMTRYPVRAVCFDNEPSAQARARQLCDKLMAFPGETMNVVLDAHDAAEAEEAEITHLRRHVLGLAA